MLKKMRLLVAALAVVGLGGGVAAETRVALVIGNAAYETIGQLRNAGNDAALIAASLSAVGFDVTALADLSEDAMGEAIDAFTTKASTADVAAVYYAGHGLQKDGENYLMPIDARLRSESAISREGIALNDLTAALADVPISLVFLDACRNNPFAEDMLNKSASDGRSAGIKRGLAVVRTPGDMLVTFATLPNTTADDGAGDNSPFAKALAQHIRTADTEVSVLMKRVTADVMAQTDGEQRPQQLSQMQKEFYFRRTTQATPTQDIQRALLTVYPPRVTAGGEVSVVADIGQTCRPSFFNLSPGLQLTPLPLQFFKVIEMANGQTRYEISPGSRYGLVVEEGDETGKNTLGYFCEPPGLADIEDKKTLLREIITRIGQGTEDGSVQMSGFGEVAFQVRPFTIE